MERQLPDYYMPPDHMIRDLHMTVEYKDMENSEVRIPVVPPVCNEQGAVQAGVIATVVDIASGALAARAVYPDIVVTSDLRMYSTQPARTGEVTAAGSVLRSGRTAVVVRTEIMAGTAGARTSIGSGIATFYRLSRRDGNVDMVKDVVSNQATVFQSDGPGLSEHLFDRAGLRVVDEAAGAVELDMSAYVKNYFGVLEGGMIAVLADVAGQHAASAVAGRPMITADLAMSYLSQGKVGPIYTKATVLRTTEDSVLTRVEVFDRGAGDALMSIAMNNATAA